MGRVWTACASRLRDETVPPHEQVNRLEMLSESHNGDVRCSGESGVARGVSISIVTYHPDWGLLSRTVSSLSRALECLLGEGLAPSAKLVAVNNGGADPSGLLKEHLSGKIARETVQSPENLGYGAGHNLALGRVESEYHLILNPDVEIAEDALTQGIAWMDAHPDAVAIAPDVREPDGSRSHLCRRQPSVRVLFLRAFAPRWGRALFPRLLDDYELRDLVDGDQPVWDPPLISGCFMLFRTVELKRLGGFDPRYFLYFEDYDLSLRAANQGRLAYVPQVRIMHAGGGAARKGLGHIKLFCRSAFRFFNSHGWRF